MNKFIMAVTCPVCGELVKADGYSIDFTADEGVVCLDMFACNDFHCDRCGTDIYVNDFDNCIDYEEPEEDIYEEE